MKTLRNLSHRFITDEAGQDLIEYALVAAVVALGAISAMQAVATTLYNAFMQIGTTLTGAL